ncbi:ulp1 protease family, C-terminal catalytic domain-containing protein [Artemisia annua]|uniref:Ulp1 protease family, C-terminal catalytic domain-containing protein n=1 Tax=Artemisia annua TaxID=35608 RepID=A0A2U1MBJ4_ARTAN|nr:ulp1 protease family, C-terminal catalytic domain-containing protein [Artemisia annua]
MGNSNMKGKDVEKSMDERVSKPCKIVAEDTTIEEQVVAGKQQDTEIDAESSFKEDEPKADNITDKNNEEKANKGRRPTQDSAQNEGPAWEPIFESARRSPILYHFDIETIMPKLEISSNVIDIWAKEPIFESARRSPILYHFDMETIMPKLEISSNVIDIWSEILNVMELYKEDTRLPSRYFFKISLINPLYYIEKHSDEEKLQSFTKSVDDSFADDEKDLKTLETFDILFFPICRENHLYLICADFKNGPFRVIDNNSNGTDFKERYKSIPEEIRKVLIAYLDQVKNQKVERIRNAKPTRMQMKWRTKNNHVDCGVFLMLHMETYHGLMNWECGLFSESDKQKRQLNLLRAKYATKILLSELNLIKNKFLKLVQAFEKKSEDERRKMIEYAIAHRDERERGKGIIDDEHSSGKRKYNRKPKNPKVDKIFEDSDSEKTIDVEDSSDNEDFVEDISIVTILRTLVDMVNKYMIKTVYKAAAKKFHPDRVMTDDLYKQVEAEETFKVIQRMKEREPIIIN